PARHVFVLNIQTNSDYNINTCSNLAGSSETWNISVQGGPMVTGVCLLSFDLKFPMFECQAPRLIPSNDPPLATITAIAASASQACAAERPALDTILVLDKSGSMASPALGTNPRTKIEALRDAVKDFVDVWGLLRGSEAASSPTPRADQIGLVFF